MSITNTPSVSPSLTTPEVTGWRTLGLLTRYHWFVFIVAALGWLFDCMDQRIFMVSRQAALTELLGYEYKGGNLVRRGGETMTDDERTEAGTTIAWYSGLATAIFMIGWATGGLIFGIMGDRWGRARTMLLTILIYSMFTGLTALSTSWWDFMLYRFLTGMGVGGEFAAGVALLAEVMPAAARPYTLGSLQALSAVGNIAGSLLSWGMGWRMLFVVGIIPAIMVVLVRRGLEEPESWKKARAEQEGDTDAHKAEMGSIREMLSDPRWRYHTIIGVLLALAGVIGLWGVGFWTFELVRLALREHGDVSGADLQRVVAWGTALQDVGACIGMLVFSAMAARMGRRFAFGIAYILALAATLFVFGTLRKESDVYWMLPLLGFCNLMVFGGFAIYFPELYPTRLRSTGTGFCYNVARYISAVGPFVLPGFIAAYTRMLAAGPKDTTPFRYATMTVACIYVLGLLTLPFAPETKGKPLPE
jgi:MFS family permease